MFYEGKRIIKVSSNKNAHRYSWWYENLIGNEFQVLSYSAISEDYLVQYNGEFRILPEKDVEVISDTSVPINASSGKALKTSSTNKSIVTAKNPKKKGERIIEIISIWKAAAYEGWYRNLIGTEFSVLSYNPVTAEYLVQYNEEFCLLPEIDVEVISDTSKPVSTSTSKGSKKKAEKSKKKGKRGNGEGTIYERKPGQWAAVISDGHDPLTGKPKRKFIYGKTQQEVADKLLDLRSQKKAGTYADPGKLTVGEWVDTWLNDYMKNSLRQTTFESYKVQVDKHINPAIGHIKLKDLETSDLQRLYNAKLERGRADKKKNEKGEMVAREGGLSPKSVRYIHGVINGALEQAIKEHKITINPAKAVKLPRNPKKEMKTLSREDVAVFLKHAKKYRYYAAYFLELATGLRRGEILALRWKDINLNEGTVKVARHLVRVNGGMIFQEPKTEKSKRAVEISGEAIQVLKEHRVKQNAEILEAEEAYEGAKDEKERLVFCTSLGHTVHPRSFVRDFQGCLKKAGLERIRFHDLRHTYATMLLEAGVALNAVQEQLGHHSPTFTAEQYGHVTKRMKKDAANVMGDILKVCTGNRNE